MFFAGRAFLERPGRGAGWQSRFRKTARLAVVNGECYKLETRMNTSFDGFAVVVL